MYKVSEVADMLRISESTLYRMIENDEIEYSRPSPRTTRIPQHEVERLKKMKRMGQEDDER